MVLKIYGVPLSTCVRRVAVVCKEKNVPYELVTLDLQAGEHKSPAYLEKQPFGQVPYIVRPLSPPLPDATSTQEDASGLIPTDPKAIALFEQAASIEVTNFDPSASGIAAEKIFKPARGVKGSDERAAELAATLEDRLQGYERILSKQKYLAGDCPTARCVKQITLADLFHLSYGYVITSIGYEQLSKTPNVARWWKDISSRPSWQAVKDGA
ncbi:hypothetical protein EW146_g7471 [Bondarzewia mesenterica]|uniref:glutathione transferase n=1 Tax=Bondarzewia mesenterica TaxID=1095465 RepID=A0A4S4LKU8_9AGAM|nr:hypothetical protein EW146_g7471 [Bondarzewia mesenterica]